MADRRIVTRIDDVTPETMDKADGWLISEFRLPFSARQGHASTMFHARFHPGAVHKKHKHENCEEIYVVLGGSGIAGAGGATEEVRAGHFHYVPADTEHWLVNAAADAPIECVGWYLGAGSVADTGYVYLGDVTEADREGPHRGYTVGALVHADDVTPESTDGGGNIREGLGGKQGIRHRAWRQTLAPGETLVPATAAGDTYLYVVSGSGRATVGNETVDVVAGSCLHVPARTPQEWAVAEGKAMDVVGLTIVGLP